MNEKNINRIGWIASLMAVLMFSAYIDQIRLNINGDTGSIILPITTVINCSTWVIYGWLKQKKDWPLIFCNSLGIIAGLLTVLTALIYG